MPARAPVVEPTRGTWVAVGFPLAALVASAVWLVLQGAHEVVEIWVPLLGLAVVSAVGERVSIQLGPRSWYTPTTPVIVLAGLLGGPLAGAAVAIAGQAGVVDTVWRRRAAAAGLGAIQGLVAGAVGLVGMPGPGHVAAVAAAAMVAVSVANSLGRWLILVERRAAPLRAVWWQGVLVDASETVIAAPIVASLVLVAAESELLVVSVLLGLLVAFAIVRRMREATIAALRAEQVNARRDILTGAPNRRAFEEMLTQHHARIVRGDQPAGLFVVDIDRFKSINDRYGHHTGDLVLLEVARRLHEGLRTADAVARWGGEEFTVLAPGIRGLRGLEQFAERIRRLVGDVPLAVDRFVLPVTVSVGGTLLDGSLSPADAIHRADSAMYEAKRDRDASIVSLPPRTTLRLESA